MSAERVTLRVMSCPRDGTILERGIHKVEDGRLECPKCHCCWYPHEVIPQ